jgi:hypothetical protein
MRLLLLLLPVEPVLPVVWERSAGDGSSLLSVETVLL